MLEEILLGIATALIGSSMAGTITYLVIKRTFSTESLLEKIDEITTAVLQDTDLQKKLYVTGSILGQGIITGTGMKTKSGKFKFEDIIAEGAGMFIQNMLKGGKDGSAQKENSETISKFSW